MGLFWKKDLTYNKDACDSAIAQLESTKDCIKDTAPNINKQLDIINNAKGFMEYCTYGNGGCNGQQITAASEYCTQIVDELVSRTREMISSIEEYNNASWWQQDLASVFMGWEKIQEGVFKLGENIVDCGASIIGFTTGWVNDDWQKSVEDFIATDWVGEASNYLYENDPVFKAVNNWSNFSHDSTTANIFKTAGTIAGYVVIDVVSGGTATVALAGASAYGRKNESEIQGGKSIYEAAPAAAFEAGKDMLLAYGFQKLGSATSSTKAASSADDVLNQTVNSSNKVGANLSNSLDDSAAAMGNSTRDITTAVSNSTDDVLTIGKNSDELLGLADKSLSSGSTAVQKADNVLTTAGKSTDDIAAAGNKASNTVKAAGKTESDAAGEWLETYKDGKYIGKTKVNSNGQKIDFKAAGNTNGSTITADVEDVVNSSSKFSKAKETFSKAKDSVNNVGIKRPTETGQIKNAIKNSKVGEIGQSAAKKVKDSSVGKIGQTAVNKGKDVVKGVKESGIVKGVTKIAVKHPTITKTLGTAYMVKEQTSAQNAAQQFRKTKESASMNKGLSEAKDQFKKDNASFVGNSKTKTNTNNSSKDTSSNNNGNSSNANSNSSTNTNNTGGGYSSNNGGGYSSSSGGSSYTPTAATSTTPAATVDDSKEQFKTKAELKDNVGRNVKTPHKRPTNTNNNNNKKPTTPIDTPNDNNNKTPITPSDNTPIIPNNTPTNPTNTPTNTPTNPTTTVTVTPNNNSGGTPQHTGGGYSGTGGYTSYGNNTASEGVTSPIESIADNTKTSIDNIVKGSKYTKIPTSSTPISDANSSGSSGSAVIPVVAGLSAAAAAGVGAKVYMDRKKNNDNGEDDEIYTEEWNGDDTINLDYDDSSDTEAYLDNDDDYGYQEAEPEEKYDARNNEELADLQ